MGKYKKPPRNPIETAINTWFYTSPLAHVNLDRLAAFVPKRWTVYEPMVLLPAGSFHTATWNPLLLDLSDEQADMLWLLILAEISKKTGGTHLTHLAVNEGIPTSLCHGLSKELSSRGNETLDNSPPENILRSPTSLRILHGDFGPAATEDITPDFEHAFWVSTRQNGIFQTWAPRWTMFSRGNIKEKARLLRFHDNKLMEDGKSPRDTWAVDLYAGIGYFTFSYAKLGMRVLCWELNPWSVEGLRRGAKGNGWSVRVVKDEHDLALPMEDLVSGGERIIVFLEDNRHAVRRIKDLGELAISHVNCGLLPTSDASWKDAWEMVGRNRGREAWLHLHENVGVADIEKRKGDIEQYFSSLALNDNDNTDRTARVEHTELVKTFAPGVWHCVFDLYSTRPTSII